VLCGVMFLVSMGGLSPSHAANSLLISWTPSVASDLAGYRVYMQAGEGDPFQIGEDVVTGASLEYVLIAAYDGVPLTFSYTAYDQAGNESDFSPPASITVDNVAPPISGAPSVTVIVRP